MLVVNNDGSRTSFQTVDTYSPSSGMRLADVLYKNDNKEMQRLTELIVFRDAFTKSKEICRVKNSLS